MAKITTITNPLTGQPAQVDQLEHTAQEIDDAIARALPGGAIDLEKAPAGYGLGKDAKFISNTDLDTLFDSGFYTTGTGCTNVPVGTDQNWSGLFVMGGRACTQIYRPADRESSYFGSFKSLLIRIHGGGTGWQPWEWVNPPMELGVEYRTTERYKGKPVYVKLVDFGALPNSTTKNVDAGISSSEIYENRMIDLGKSTTYNPSDDTTSVFPIGTGIVNIYINNGDIRITTNADRSGWSAKICVKYTKTTD